LQKLKWPGAVETPLPRNKPDDREAQERDGREKSDALDGDHRRFPSRLKTW
jgi:hypothetical protein